MASVFDSSDVLERELNPVSGSFIAGIRFDLHWDPVKFAEMCQALHAISKAHIGSKELRRDVSQLFWYCGTFLPMWIEQRDFRVGQPHVDYDKAYSLLKRLGDGWFGDDCLLTDEEFARELAAV
jgi:hypothetical protein